MDTKDDTVSSIASMDWNINRYIFWAACTDNIAIIRRIK
jgi:hypothetical protein